MMDMVKRYKASRFNHFFTDENGERLAFNAMTCSLASIDDKAYAVYENIVNGSSNDLDESDETVKKLIAGRFIVPEELDEVNYLKVLHYHQRFHLPIKGLTIAPTLNCNFDCVYCYEGEKQALTMTNEIMDALLKYIDTFLISARRFSVGWYGGEPLLCLDKIEYLTQGIFEICRNKEVMYSSGIITNGYLFTKAVAKQLGNLNVRFAQVTLDGPEKIHDARRPLRSGRGTYSAIVKNIIEASEVFPRISIRVNVDRNNIKTIPAMLLDLHNMGLHLRQNVLIHFAPVAAATLACQDVAPYCLNAQAFSKVELELYQKGLELGFKCVRYPDVRQW
jgi:uncharacterized protein